MRKVNRRRALLGSLGVAVAAFLPKVSKGEDKPVDKSLQIVPSTEDAYILPNGSELRVYENAPVTPVGGELVVTEPATIDPQCKPPLSPRDGRIYGLPTLKMNDVLRQCGSQGVDGIKALNNLTDAMNPAFARQLQDELSDIEWVVVPSGELWGSDDKYERIELGTCGDVKIEYARTARWDVVSRAIQLMQNSLVRKINDKKCEGAVAEFCELWPDFTLTKQRRIGWYTWVELYLPR